MSDNNNKLVQLQNCPPKVSVIIPSLNSVKYLKDTMESVVSQKLKEIEILCVDAGSTDGTLKMLEDYAEHDKRIRIIHSPKKSYGYQMNLGMEAATGEYIGIVESDDYIDSDMYFDLYQTAIEYHADIVKSDADLFITDEDGNRLFATYRLKKYCRVEYNKVYSGDKYLQLEAELECYIWNAIYKSSFLREKKVRFNESPGASFQDFGFRYQTSPFAERIVAVNKAFYKYRRDNVNSSTYNSRTAEFNERESEYILDKLKENGIIQHEAYRFIAGEIVNYAHGAFLLMLEWVKPAFSTLDALERYRELFGMFYKKKYVTHESVNPELYKAMLLLIESRDLYFAYAKIMAGIERDKQIRYLQKVRAWEKIVIFGAGYRGNAVYVYLKRNKIQYIEAFCDNNADKHNSDMYGVPVMFPEEAAKKYPDALYIITAAGGSNKHAMEEQLAALGIDKDRITDYPLDSSPVFVTNCGA